MPSQSLEETIRKHALKNAHDYKLAMPAKIVGKVIGEFPGAKNDMKATMKLINEEAKRVNSLPQEQVERELSEFEFAEKKEEKKEIGLPGAVEGRVVTRFPPEPSGYPHIGHAKAAWLDYEAARRYGGKMILRFDDTNPEKERLEYELAIKKGLEWLGIEWEQESHTSDRMGELYAFCEELIVGFSAYACTCSAEEIKKGREEGRACDCPARDAQESLTIFKKMREGKMDEGAAIVRFRGDMKSQNTVMRDPTLFRIIKKEHYRQGSKYSAWPSYDFAAPIMDSLEGVTHAMRTKEYELRNPLYFAMLKKLGLRAPALIEFSRLAIKGAPVSKRRLVPLIESGKVMGWDDPRLPTLSALARRGILPEAVRDFVLSFGISKVESEPGWDALLARNRKILDERCERRFFVADPVGLEVSGAPEREAVLKNHPQRPEMGERTIRAGGEFYIARKDADALLEGETFRLKDLYNATLGPKGAGRLSARYEGDEGIVAKKLQWVPCDSAVRCKVLVPKDLLDEKGGLAEGSLEEAAGFCEKSCLGLEEGTVVQFERFGYARLDKKEENRLEFIFSC